jgi:arylsulfatase A-like enzyme
LAVAILAVAILPAACSRGERAAVERGPHVVLITVDTLRRDYVSFYADPPLPTPAFDRFGHEGGAADLAVAPYGRTTQSVGTIMTGLHPLRHGAEGLGLNLPAEVTTLAEHFRAAGYRTLAFVSNRNLRPGLGFDQGFEHYGSDPSRYRGNSADALTREAIEWIEAQEAFETPLFLWVHYLDPHWGYLPPMELARLADPNWTRPVYLRDWPKIEGLEKSDILYFGDRHLTDREVDHTQRLYSAEIAAVDQEVGRLVSVLDAAGILREALVCFTSDHGEGTGEHDYYFGHGEYIYEGVLRVPLMFWFPGSIPVGTRVGGVVRLEDVAPTILDLAGLSVPADLDGQSIAPLLREGGMQEPPPVTGVHLSDFRLVRQRNPRQTVPGRAGQWWAIRRDGYKYLRIPLRGGEFEEELYDLERDPDELVNLVAERPQVAARLRAEVERRMRTRRDLSDEPPLTTAEDLEALRSLGYVD